MNKTPLAYEILKGKYSTEEKSSFQIAKELNCSEHKVNYWLEKYQIQKRSISDAIYVKSNPLGDPFKAKPILTLKDANLFGMGLGLYWGEGNKKDKHAVRLGNSNPLLIKKFLEFLINLFQIDKSKLRFGLQIFGDMPRKKSLNFWLNQLKGFGIKRKQFFKTTITPYRGVGNYREKSKHGVLTVHFGNCKLKRALDSMLPE